MCDTKRFKTLIDSNGVKYGFLANMLGLSLKSFYNKMYGKTEFKFSEGKKLAEFFEISVKERDQIFWGVKK